MLCVLILLAMSEGAGQNAGMTAQNAGTQEGVHGEASRRKQIGRLIRLVLNKREGLCRTIDLMP